MPDTKILVIEDDFYFSDLISHAMEEQGLQFDLFVRANPTEDGISFMSADGKTRLLDYSQYWVALVDSRLKGSVLQGVDLASSLPSQGLPVIAMSGLDSLNSIMMDRGALLMIRKDVLWVDLFRGKLNLKQMVQDAQTKLARKS